MRFMSEDKRRVSGHGDVLLSGGRVGFLLVHGLGGTPAEVRLLAQGLNRQGYTVLCPLLRGHGGSDLLLSATNWSQWLETVEQAYGTLKAQCDTVIIGGQSAGAMLAIHLAANHADEVPGLVLYSPTFWPNGWAIPWHFHLFRLIRTRWFANLINVRERKPYGIKDERIRKLVVESLQRDGRSLDDIHGRRGGTIFEFRRLADAARAKLKDISAPTLIVHSREDDQSHVSNAFYAAKHLAGPTEFVLLNDSYHLVTLDRQRMHVMDRTVGFCDAISARESRKAATRSANASVMHAANER